MAGFFLCVLCSSVVDKYRERYADFPYNAPSYSPEPL